MQLFSNNASTTLASAINDIATSMLVATGTGSLFATPTGYGVPAIDQYELITISQGSNIEIVKCTSRSGDNFFIQRAQEGTTAQNWSVGAKVESRITKGTLENIYPLVKTPRGGIRIGSGSSVYATGSLALGEFSTASYGSSQGNQSLAIGNYAKANSEYSDAQLTTLAPEILRSTTYSYKDYVTYSGNYYYCVSGGTTGTGTPLSILEDGRYIDGTSVWVETAMYPGAIAVGALCRSNNASSVIGYNSYGLGDSSVVLGSIASAEKDYSISIGSRSYSKHKDAVSIGHRSASYVESSLNTSRLPYIGSYPDWWFGYEYEEYCGLQGYIQSEPIDLTGGVTWSASTASKHGYVVKPTTPNGCQYVRWCYNYDAWNKPLSLYTPGLTSTTEPTWPTVLGNSVTDGDGDWVCVPNDGTYILNLPVNSYMLLEEVGFIAYDASSITSQANISIGTGGADLTSIVNNQPSVALTSSMSACKWALAQPRVVQTISIKIDTLATGTRLLGRFHFKGVLTKHWV